MGELKVYSLEEVKQHSKKGKDPDVWIVIHDKVYDVTKFLDNVTYFPSNGTRPCIHSDMLFCYMCSIRAGKKS